MNNFSNYAKIARDYAVPEAKQTDTYKWLTHLDDVIKQFETAPNREEWCKRVEENNNEVFYIVQILKNPFTNNLPKLELKYVGPGNGVPTIKIYVSKTYCRQHGFNCLL